MSIYSFFDFLKYSESYLSERCKDGVSYFLLSDVLDLLEDCFSFHAKLTIEKIKQFYGDDFLTVLPYNSNGNTVEVYFISWLNLLTLFAPFNNIETINPSDNNLLYSLDNVLDCLGINSINILVFLQTYFSQNYNPVYKDHNLYISKEAIEFLIYNKNKLEQLNINLLSIFKHLNPKQFNLNYIKIPFYLPEYKLMVIERNIYSEMVINEIKDYLSCKVLEWDVLSNTEDIYFIINKNMYHVSPCLL